MMKLITRQTLANEALSHWVRQYGDTWNDKRDALVALGAEPAPDDVDAVIGNRTWTHKTCDECNEDSDAVVMLGEEPGYESATVYVCKTCLIKAFALLEHTDTK